LATIAAGVCGAAMECGFCKIQYRLTAQVVREMALMMWRIFMLTSKEATRDILEFGLQYLHVT
jgi:hypothetical protein